MGDEVRRLREAELEDAVRILTGAFFDSAWWTFILPDETDRQRTLPLVMRSVVRRGLLMGETYVLGTPARAIAIWEPPGMTDAELDPDDSRIGSAEVRSALGQDATRRLDLFVDTLRPHVERDMPSDAWYLPSLAVEPSMQRRGAGSALLGEMIPRLDAEGRAIFLDTAKAANVLYYQRFGFEVLQEGVVPDVDGPSFWIMRRGGR
jgi:ribosomal protein S18 acetylase RimI-like enzyme